MVTFLSQPPEHTLFWLLPRVRKVSREAWPISNCGACSWPKEIPAERERPLSQWQSRRQSDSLQGQGLKSPEGRATACDSFLKADRLTGGSHWELQIQHWEKQKNSTKVSIKTQSHKNCQECTTISWNDQNGLADKTQTSVIFRIQIMTKILHGPGTQKCL